MGPPHPPRAARHLPPWGGKVFRLAEFYPLAGKR